MVDRPRGKSPAKAVDKEFKRIGATRRAVRNGVEYRFPDDARIFVPANVSWQVAHSMMRNAGIRNGVSKPRPPIVGDRIPITILPPVDTDRMTLTDHAKQRFAEMETQDGITAAEVALALTCPMHALWMEQHGTYAWVGERITVVGHEREGWLTIRTFLWSTNELWDEHPRLEKQA